MPKLAKKSTMFLGGFFMSDCLFCKIIDGSIPSYTVYEDDNVKVF